MSMVDLIFERLRRLAYCGRGLLAEDEACIAGVRALEGMEGMIPNYTIFDS